MTSLARTIREQVANLIRDDVLAGHFPAGQPLRETEIAARFGVSRGPVRDAFLQLTQEGFLAYQANRGVTVRHPPDSQNRDFIVHLRRQIEEYIVRGGLQQLGGEQMAAVEKALHHLRTACEAEEVPAVAGADIAFHQTLLEVCGGGDFLPIWKWLCSQMLLAYSQLADFRQIYREHERIMEGVRAKNKRAVAAAIKANIR